MLVPEDAGLDVGVWVLDEEGLPVGLFRFDEAGRAVALPVLVPPLRRFDDVGRVVMGCGRGALCVLGCTTGRS